MKRFDGYKIRLVLIGFVATIVLGGGSARADFTFGKPVNLGPNINSSSVEVDPSISADGLELFFESRRPSGHGPADIYVSRRASKDDPWGPCMNIGAPVNTEYWDQCPSISADGLSLYFSSDRPGGYGIDDLWVTTRASVSDPWVPPVNLGATVNTSADEWMPSISADGLVLFFMSSRAGGFGGNDLWFTSRATKNDPWGSPVNLGATINSSLHEAFPDISADSRMLFFSDHMLGPWRPGGYGGQDIWITTRTTTNDPWGKPMNLGPVINSSDYDTSPNISADGSTLYFCSNRPGGIGTYDLWQAPIIPIVDFNGDEKVDLKDFSRLAQYWGQNESSVDMGPMPWGDGIVDLKDLFVLSEYWLKEVTDPRLIAYWKLDETEGDIAYDSAGSYQGALNGGPLWHPTGGRVNGALQLDGVDDYVSAPFVLNPKDGPFSVFAWVKTISPARVVISQTATVGFGRSWLCTDASGNLMTELKASGRGGFPLVSQAVITDDQWHRVGLAWDGAYRTLYVDGTEVAKDSTPQQPLETANGGLYIGAASNRAAGTFWSGLIDDVRVYDRAVQP
jgi:Tol biopolymer transport system component